jgi:hypothetical protein
MAAAAARALVRRRARTDDVAHHRVVLRHDERAELLRRLLVPHAAVGVLQREHPLQVPSDLGQIVRSCSARLRNSQVQIPQALWKELPRPQQSPHGHAAVDDVSAVVAGVVPAAVAGHFAAAARRRMISALQVARRMLVAAPEIDRATAPLPIVRAHCEAQRVAPRVPPNGNCPAFPSRGDKAIASRRSEPREIRSRDAIAGANIVNRWPGRAAKCGSSCVCIAQLERSSSLLRGNRRDLANRRQESCLVQGCRGRRGFDFGRPNHQLLASDDGRGSSGEGEELDCRAPIH